MTKPYTHEELCQKVKYSRDPRLWATLRMLDVERRRDGWLMFFIGCLLLVDVVLSFAMWLR